MWTWLASFISGPVIGAAIKAYTAKLAAGNTTDRIAADLAGRELTVQAAEVQAQAAIKIAEIGHWYEPDKLFAYTLWIYFTKVYLYDAAFGLGSTDAVRGDVAMWGALVISFYFGKRGVENLARIIGNRFGK